MKQAKKKLTMAIGMAVGVTMLAGAAFASYNTSNGYEVGKTAVKGLMSNENYTAELKFDMLIDGENISSTEVKELYDRNGDVRRNKIEKTEVPEAYQYYLGSTVYEEYFQDNERITVYHNADGTETSLVFTGEYDEGIGNFDVMEQADDEEKATADKVVRFVELAADTFVGDLKNNVIYVSGDDNSSSYELNLDAVQIPEVINAGLSAMFSSMSTYSDETDDPFMMFGTDPVIKNVSLKFTVDSEGRFTDAKASAILSGGGHEGEAEVSLKMYDYGTTKPERIDKSTLENVETYNITENGIRSTSASIDTAEERNLSVDDDGNVLNSDGESVGTVEINSDGEGVIVYND